MRIHTSSMVTGMDRFTGVKPLWGYADSIVRVRIEDSDLKQITKLIADFNIENLKDEFLESLLDESGVIPENHFMPMALVFSLIEHIKRPLSMGIIKAYALRLNVGLSSTIFEKILNALHSFKVFTVQNDNGVLKYELQPNGLKSIYAVEA